MRWGVGRGGKGWRSIREVGRCDAFRGTWELWSMWSEVRMSIYGMSVVARNDRRKCDEEWECDSR